MVTKGEEPLNIESLGHAVHLRSVDALIDRLGVRCVRT